MTTQLLQTLYARFGRDGNESNAAEDAADADRLLSEWAEYVTIPGLSAQEDQD